MFKLPIISALFMDFLFLYLIIGVSLVETNLIQLRSRLFSYLGSISYGIYMYHMMIIFAVVLLLKKQWLEMNIFSGTLLYYSLLLVTIILVASISKYCFENYFLRLKERINKKQHHHTFGPSAMRASADGHTQKQKETVS